MKFPQIIVAALAISPSAFAAVDCAPSTNPFGRSDVSGHPYCAVQQCPNDGPWSRGRVTLQADGTVWIYRGLETNSVFLGVAGQVSFALNDSGGQPVVDGDVPGVEIGPKPIRWAGGPRIENLPGISLKIPLEQARRVKSISVTATCQASFLWFLSQPTPHGLSEQARKIEAETKVDLGKAVMFLSTMDAEPLRVYGPEEATVAAHERCRRTRQELVDALNERIELVRREADSDNRIIDLHAPAKEEVRRIHEAERAASNDRIEHARDAAEHARVERDRVDRLNNH